MVKQPNLGRIWNTYDKWLLFLTTVGVLINQKFHLIAYIIISMTYILVMGQLREVMSR